MARNQKPAFSVHSEYRVFQNTGENVIESAVYAVSPGSSFGYPTKSVDDEAAQATLYPIPFTLHPTPYTLHPTPDITYPMPYTLYPLPCTLYPGPYTLYPIP